MMKANRIVGVLAGFGLLLGASGAFAQDWPQWRGPHRDAKASGFQAPKTWPKELTQKWKVKVGDGVATPALAGDKLYVFTREGSQEVIRCLNAVTGMELWQDKHEAPEVTRPANSFPGPRCSPAVAEGKVVTIGVGGTLSCLDAKGGKVLWRKDDFKSHPRFFTSSSPLLVDGLCIAQLGAESKGGIVAYDLGSGTEKWKWTGDGTAYASPILDTVEGSKEIVAETSASIVGVGAGDGKLLWKTPFPATGGMRTYNACTPIAHGSTIIYSGAGRGTKAVKIDKEGEKLVPKELWTNKDNAVQFNTPVLTNSLLFGISNNDKLFCINTKDGKTAWTESVPSPGGRTRGYGSVVDAGPVLFALTPSAQLIVFEPSDKQFKEIARYKVAEGNTFAYPIISGNRVYVKDRDSLILWTIE